MAPPLLGQRGHSSQDKARSPLISPFRHGEAMAVILPFPASRRLRAIWCLASQMAGISPVGAEHLLHARLKRHAAALARKGINHEVVTADVDDFEAAIRAAFLRAMLRGNRA